MQEYKVVIILEKKEAVDHSTGQNMGKIVVDFSKCTGPVKPLNGVNNGPVGVNNVRGVSNAEAYKAANIPFGRLHDSAFSSYYGGEDSVDVHRIFKDFDADVDDPASYDFEPTDKYLLTFEKVGTEIVYRLGAAIEHDRKKGTLVPKDYLKWAKICEHIIRHYNEGWANGYALGIRYWEIWNEPDCQNADGSNPCWQGTKEQFADFFETVAKYLKSCFPALKIGGPAFCNMHEPVDRYYLSEFQRRGIELDFISYHRYCDCPEDFIKYIRDSNEIFAEYGFGSTEKHLNEWNYVAGWLGEVWKQSLRDEKGLKGSSFVLSCICASQYEDVDVLCYYDARPCAMNGLFSWDVLDILKPYYAIKMFGDLRKYKTSYSLAADAHIFGAAALNDTEGGILFSYFDNEPSSENMPVELIVKNLPGKYRADFYLQDKDRDLEPVRSDILSEEESTIYLNMTDFSSYQVKLTKM